MADEDAAYKGSMELSDSLLVATGEGKEKFTCKVTMEVAPPDNRYPGETDDANPDVFTVAPPYDGDTKPGQLTAEQRKQFFEDGFVVIEDYLPKPALDAVRRTIEELVENLAQKLYKAGKISHLYTDEDLYTRLLSIDKECPGSNIILIKTLGALPTAIQDLWSHELFLNAAEQLLGTREIQGHPVWNLRAKTPHNDVTNVPWHQDVAYLHNDSYDVMHVSAWIPLLDTNQHNGCMQMMRRGHRSGKVANHQCCHGGTWYVMLEEEEMERKLGIDVKNDLVTCPVPYGGVVFFNNLIPHHSLTNRSDKVRWTMDLRWLRADKTVGFFGVKPGIQLSSADPGFNIDWDSFNSINRATAQSKVCEEEWDEFDTTIHGPWMKQWEITHTNRHTEAMDKRQ